jgi:8-oxo-dGTP diphosphatase
VIRAAGGVLWRPGESADAGEPTVEVAVVHRPKHDDWTLPKGKLASDEHLLLAAVREVIEETAITPQVQRWLATTSYEADGKPKTVDYWAMRAMTGEFRPGDEVDDLLWLCPAEALRTSTYDRDRSVIEALLGAPCDTSAVLLVRHGSAGDSDTWDGDDDLRPLDPDGHRQADAIAQVLPVYRPTRVLSAEPLRCVDTVRPLANRLGLAVEVDPVFGERMHAKDPMAMASRLRLLSDSGQPTVVCSQGGAIPETLELLARDDEIDFPDVRAAKGSTWVLTFDTERRLVAADYYRQPTKGRPEPAGATRSRDDRR